MHPRFFVTFDNGSVVNVVSVVVFKQPFLPNLWSHFGPRRNESSEWNMTSNVGQPSNLLGLHCIIVSAVGCPNMIPPENAWLRRTNDIIIIGCISSAQTWQLTCVGREWIGDVGTCSETCKCVASYWVVELELNYVKVTFHQNRAYIHCTFQRWIK